MKNIIVSKDSFSEFNCWKETESIEVTSENEDYKLLSAFQAGYDSGSSYIAKKVTEVSKSKINTSTIHDKLLNILFTHYGLRDFYVDIYGNVSYKATLHMELQTPFNGFVDLFETANSQVHVKSIDPWVTCIELVCYTPDVTKTLLEVITKLTK